MNDQQHPYDPYYPQPQIIGYDEYGQPVYQQPQASQQGQGQHYDPYGGQQQQSQPQQGYGYDSYAQQQYQAQQPQAHQQPQAPEQPQEPQYDPYGQQGYAYPSYDTGQQWSVQADPSAAQAPAPAQAPVQAPSAAPVATPPGVPGQRPASERSAPARQAGTDDDRDYRTEQFSFIEEPDEDSEDVIDWLKFTESRSERREEARRRGRVRIIALVVVLVLAAVGGVGYLWSAGMLPGSSDGEQKENTATGPQKRDTIVVHLHNTTGGGTSTALLVNNSTTRQGTTVLLPNSVVVADGEGAATTLGKSVEDDGSSGTREAIGNLLGAPIAGTWRLDTPYLDTLVDLVSGIEMDTDTEVPDTKKGADPLVRKGEKQSLNGRAAVAYATYRAPGEAETKQLQRFGQVMYAVLRKISDNPESATMTVESLTQIFDPSLSEKDLGASLAKLAEHAKVGDYKTALLPVGQDGALTEGASDSVVKDILGGKVTAPEAGDVTRVSLRDGSGKKATEAARVVLINGGYSFMGGTEADTQEKSQVVYGDDAQKPTAAEVAKTLGLPAGSVTKGKPSGAAAVTVILGKDYEVPGAR
ncbi:LCP family protein [Streptomyces sp. NBC_00572]|uniref:LCP family protein n=1 Tax=Streptomyces sp. NBC_00572 TaxID=2903664 RepID=UPI00225629AF|nr:LCP family protein [Streptomyces sp. NBC_00572]MCX4980859.1 LCP family protein [Streptomyces sp. NBC_00572]